MTFPDPRYVIVAPATRRRTGLRLSEFRATVAKMRQTMTQAQAAAALGVTRRYIQKLEAQARSERAIEEQARSHKGRARAH